MKLASTILVSLTALLHIGFCILESFLWTTPFGLKAFRMTKEMAEATKVLAQNQGLYNLFLAAGLIWGVCADDFRVKVFFLSCVIIAGIVGAVTASKNIIFVQALPAALALIAVYFASKS